MGATFPVQASSGDYFFSQSEIQSYLARAQNQFLADVPSIFALNTQFVQIGNIYQQLVCDAITMERVASSSQWVALSCQLTRYSATMVLAIWRRRQRQAVSQSPHGLILDQKFSIFNPLDPSFAGAFTVGNVLVDIIVELHQNSPNDSQPAARLYYGRDSMKPPRKNYPSKTHSGATRTSRGCRTGLKIERGIINGASMDDRHRSSRWKCSSRHATPIRWQ